MKMSVPKLLLLHLGRRNPRFDYFIDGHLITSPDFVRDLGIKIDCNLSFKTHLRDIIGRAVVRASVVRRSFRYSDILFRLQMYKTFVRPMLEYSNCVWSPHFQTDVVAIENVQRKFSKYLPGLFNLSYDERLRQLNLFQLSDRRLISDVVMLFKIIKGLCHLSMSDFNLAFCSYGRGHYLKLNVLGSASDCRRYSFICRTISVWNALHESTINCSTVHCFKCRILQDVSFVNSLSSAARSLCPPR